MRFLERTPDRYDAGMRFITFGAVDDLHDALAVAVVRQAGDRVVEIGCGTGTLTARLVARGAEVTAFDQNAAMMAQAEARLRAATAGRVSFVERTAAEMDSLPPASADAVVASLSFSEMSADERAFVLVAACRALRPGGLLAIGDEVRPRRWWQRAVFAFVRGPQAALGWLLAGSLSHPIADLSDEVARAGFVVRSEQRWLLGTLAVVVADRPDGETR